jgi:hypothetical protein
VFSGKLETDAGPGLVMTSVYMKQKFCPLMTQVALVLSDIQVMEMRKSTTSKTCREFTGIKRNMLIQRTR